MESKGNGAQGSGAYFNPSICNSKDPQLMISRVFVGNLPTDLMTKEEFHEWFSKFGKVLGSALHKGFGFLQFAREEDARAAVQATAGTTYKEYRIDIKMALEGRKPGGPGGPGGQGGQGYNNHSNDSSRSGQVPPPREFVRDRSPIRGDYDDRFRDPRDAPYRRDEPMDRGGSRVASDRPPVGRDGLDRPDVGRDGYDRPPLGRDGPDRLGRDGPDRLGRDVPDRLGRDVPDRLGLGREPLDRERERDRDRGDFRRLPAADDPYYSRAPPPPPPRDEYRRDAAPPPSRDPYRDSRDDYYRDPYERDRLPLERVPLDRAPLDRTPLERAPPIDRDRYERPAPKLERPPFDCSIILYSRQQMEYAESIEKRLKPMAMLVDIHVLAPDAQVANIVENLSKRKIPYAVVVNGQNVIHRSITLNILHGSPQEHRNMPLEDAMSLITRNFEKYLKALREKPIAPSNKVLLPPDSQLAYLLNLLSDGRHLTLDELQTVGDFVSERKRRLMEAEGIKQAKAQVIVKPSTPTLSSSPRPIPAPVPEPSVQPSDILKQQAELQAKILNILNPTPLTAGVAASQLPNLSASSTLPRLTDTINSSSNFSAGLAGFGLGSLSTSKSDGFPSTSLPLNLNNPNIQKALDSLMSTGLPSSADLMNLSSKMSSVDGGASSRSVGGAHGVGGGHGDAAVPPRSTADLGLTAGLMGLSKPHMGNMGPGHITSMGMSMGMNTPQMGHMIRNPMDVGMNRPMGGMPMNPMMSSMGSPPMGIAPPMGQLVGPRLGGMGMNPMSMQGHRGTLPGGLGPAPNQQRMF